MGPSKLSGTMSLVVCVGLVLVGLFMLVTGFPGRNNSPSLEFHSRASGLVLVMLGGSVGWAILRKWH
jgi:hypothetical protein